MRAATVSVHVPNWLAAWKWAPLIAALGLRTSMGPFSVSATFLVIPVAVRLAARYGRAGLAVVAVSGLPLVLEASVAGTFRSPAAVSVYATAVLLAWWLSQSPGRPLLPRMRLTPWVYAALLLLPLRLGLGNFDVEWLEAIGATDLRLVLDGYTVFFLLVFALGASRVPAAPITVFLWFLAVMGTGLEYLHLPNSAADLFRADRADLPGLGLVGLRSLFVHYRFDTPAQWLTALAWFGFGRFLGRTWANVNDLPALTVRVSQLTALAFLALGGYVNEYFLGAFGNALVWLGSYHALVLAAVVAGLYFEFAGVVALCLLITAFSFVDALLRAALYGMSGLAFTVDLGDFLIAYGFGALGMLIRSGRVRGPVTVWSGPWARFLLIYLLLVLALVPLNSPAAPPLVLTVFFGGIAAAMALGAARERLTGGTITLRGGWLSLATVLMLSYLAWSFAVGTWEALLRGYRQAMTLGTELLVAAEALDEEAALMLGFLVPAFLLLLWTFGTTVEKLAETTGEFRTDIRALLRRWRERVPMVIRLESKQDREEPAKPGAARTLTIRSLRWINRSLLAAAVAAPVCLLTYNAWLDYREDLARDREDLVISPEDGTSAGAVQGRHPALARERAEQQYRRSRDRFTEVLIRAAQRRLVDFPGVTVQRGRFEAHVRTDWRLDPADPAVRRRVTVTIQPAIGYDEMPAEQAVRRSLWVRTSRQDRGLFRLWLEGARDAPLLDNSMADNLERAIETTALAALDSEADQR